MGAGGSMGGNVSDMSLKEVILYYLGSMRSKTLNTAASVFISDKCT